MAALDRELDIIRESLGYAHRFRGRLFVLHIELPVIENQFFPIFIKDIATLHQSGIRMILVPGTREKVVRTLEEYKVPQHSHHGLRITDEAALPFVEMVAFNIANKLMSALAGEGVRSVIGNWVRAKGRGIIDGVDYKYTGVVERIDTQALNTILDQDVIPIFPPIGWNANGKTYNVAADELSVSVSSQLTAEKLFFVGEGRAVQTESLSLPESLGIESGQRISRLTVQEARELVKLNQEGNQMIRKVDLGRKACESGVERVHLVDGLQEGVILQEIFSNMGIGTMIHTSIFESIRPMERNDVSEVLRVMEPYITQGILVPRDTRSLEDQYQDYVVYDMDGRVHGCAAMHLYADNQGEIAGIAVDRGFAGLGIGRRLVLYLVEKARERGLKKIFALTTQTADWFETLGFRQGELKEIARKKRHYYNTSRKSKIYVYDL
ncbi:MAG: amino-acid N-acetyltransferase [Spirochaetia bacterium]